MWRLDRGRSVEQSMQPCLLRQEFHCHIWVVSSSEELMNWSCKCILRKSLDAAVVSTAGFDTTAAGQLVDSQGRPLLLDASGNPINEDGLPVAADALGNPVPVSGDGVALDPFGKKIKGTAVQNGVIIDTDTGKPAVFSVGGQLIDGATLAPNGTALLANGQVVPVTFTGQPLALSPQGTCCTVNTAAS
jgi:hypothetical protein